MNINIWNSRARTCKFQKAAQANDRAVRVVLQAERKKWNPPSLGIRVCAKRNRETARSSFRRVLIWIDYCCWCFLSIFACFFISEWVMHSMGPVRAGHSLSSCTSLTHCCGFFFLIWWIRWIFFNRFSRIHTRSRAPWQCHFAIFLPSISVFIDSYF